jgi:uroporphyrinogen-III decarboxylase
MNSRERILAALDHRVPDRVPRFEVWIDALWNELGQGDPVTAAVDQGQDCLMMPTRAQDGNILPLLPMAVEAGFAGVHGLDPSAGMDLGLLRKQYGRQLALVGNIDVRVLCGTGLAAVRGEVARCYEQGGGEGGFMISTCNSIFEGMNPLAVKTMFRCQAEFDGSGPGSL